MEMTMSEAKRITTEENRSRYMPDLHEACQVVLQAAKERADFMHDTWDLDAHVELTLTISELRSMHAALARDLEQRAKDASALRGFAQRQQDIGRPSVASELLAIATRLSAH
jgi:hypothetical protein